jgi:hypothetical protein
MTLSDLANLSQIIAAAGVVISLLYLAIQIRGNTKVVSDIGPGFSEDFARWLKWKSERAGNPK